MLRGIGPVPADSGLGEWATGDALDRMRWWLDRTGEALLVLDDRTPLQGDDGPRAAAHEGVSRRVIEALPSLLAGAEWAGTRLIVASLDPDVAQVAHDVTAGRRP